MLKARTVSVRRARAIDFPVIQQLVLEMDAFHHAKDPQRIKPAAAALLRQEDFVGFLADGAQLVSVAEKDRDVVGFVRAKLQDAPEGRAHRARRSVSIHEVVTHPSARRLGVGKKLVEEVCGWAARQRAAGVELNVYAFNTEALQFYRSLGFSNLTFRLAKAL